MTRFNPLGPSERSDNLEKKENRVGSTCILSTYIEQNLWDESVIFLPLSAHIYNQNTQKARGRSRPKRLFHWAYGPRNTLLALDVWTIPQLVSYDLSAEVRNRNSTCQAQKLCTSPNSAPRLDKIANKWWALTAACSSPLIEHAE